MTHSIGNPVLPAVAQRAALCAQATRVLRLTAQAWGVTASAQTPAPTPVQALVTSAGPKEGGSCACPERHRWRMAA